MPAATPVYELTGSLHCRQAWTAELLALVSMPQQPTSIPRVCLAADAIAHTNQACSHAIGPEAVAPYMETVEQVKEMVGATKLRPLKGAKLCVPLAVP